MLSTQSNRRSRICTKVCVRRRATRGRFLPATLILSSLCPLIGCMEPHVRPMPAGSPRMISVEKIWDRGPHNAFTDLARFRDAWYCTFREGVGHAKGDGRIRVLVSTDGKKWQSAALLSEEGVDLRDPKLSVTPDNRLMVVAGGSIYRDGKFVTRRSRVAFSSDGRTWTPTQPVLPEGEWLWRVTWHNGMAYGAAYSGSSVTRNLTLWSSRDGLHYEMITTLRIPGGPCETTLRFDPDGRMVALVRNEGKEKEASVGLSQAPYTRWRWRKVDHRVGGPDFVVLPDGSMWGAGRYYGHKAETVLAWMTPNSYTPTLTLPSGGDNSYPGMVWHDGLLWMSYYSSHEGKASIYLAKIQLPEPRMD